MERFTKVVHEQENWKGTREPNNILGLVHLMTHMGRCRAGRGLEHVQSWVV